MLYARNSQLQCTFVKLIAQKKQNAVSTALEETEASQSYWYGVVAFVIGSGITNLFETEGYFLGID